MISLDKRYTTLKGLEVVLSEIVGSQVFGRVQVGTNGVDRWRSHDWMVETGYRIADVPDNEFNLKEVPQIIKRRIWVNIYALGRTPPETFHHSERSAERNADENRLARACVDIEIESGSIQ